MSIEEKLFGLLRSSLWGGPYDVTISLEEVRQLINLANKQAVGGLVIDWLFKKDVHMEQGLLFEAIGFLEQVRQKNKQMNQEVAGFARLMKSSNVDYLVVKGQTIASLYPEPCIRMPGDIDFLVKDYYYASEVLKKQWGVEFPKQMAEKEFAFSRGSILYELHTYLIDFGSNKHKLYWEKILSESRSFSLKIGGEKVNVMEPTLCAVYLFLHLFFHFVKEGLGLRQLCDWAIMMHYYSDEIENKRLAEILNKIGMLKAFCVFGTILVDKLGMKDFPLALMERDRKLQARILKDIMYGGNFGREKHDAKQVGLRHKFETMLLTMTNCWRYYTLAPKEMLLIPYRRMVVNLKLLKQ